MLEENKNGAEYLFEKSKRIQIEKKKEKNRKKMITILGILFVLLFIYIYFVSEYSKIQYITISGNRYISKEPILNSLSVKKGDYILFIRKNSIKNKILENPFIEKADIIITKDRILQIQIQEKRMLGYRKDELVGISDKGELIPIDTEVLNQFIHLPVIEGFEDKQDESNDKALRDSLIQSLLTIEESVYHNISTICQYKFSYDPYAIQIQMDDGNYVYTSLSRCKELNQYYDIMKVLKVNNSCIFIDEYSGNAYSSACPKPVENKAE